MKKSFYRYLTVVILCVSNAAIADDCTTQGKVAKALANTMLAQIEDVRLKRSPVSPHLKDRLKKTRSINVDVTRFSNCQGTTSASDLALKMILEEINKNAQEPQVTEAELLTGLLSSIVGSQENINHVQLASPVAADVESMASLKTSPGTYTHDLLNGNFPDYIFKAYDEHRGTRQQIRDRFMAVAANLPIDPKTGLINLKIVTELNESSLNGYTGELKNSAYQQSKSGLMAALNEAYGPITGLKVGGVDNYVEAYVQAKDNATHTMSESKVSSGVIVYLVSDPMADIKIEILKAKTFQNVNEAREVARQSYLKSQTAAARLFKEHQKAMSELKESPQEIHGFNIKMRPISSEAELKQVLQSSGADKEVQRTALEGIIDNLRKIQTQAASTENYAEAAKYKTAAELAQAYLEANY